MNYIILTVHRLFTLLSKSDSFQLRGFKILLRQNPLYSVFDVSKALPRKCLATKRDQTLFGDQTFSRFNTLFDCV